VIAGFNGSPSATTAFGVLRYQGNGALDAAFGTGGRATAAFTNFINMPNGGALQPDGKIVVIGNAQSADGTLSEFAVARFNANGTLDSAFGTGGKVTTNFVGVKPGGVSNPATSVLVQPDGRILVGGSASQCPRASCGGTKTALARYNANGSLDTTFGSGGTVSVTAIGQASALGEDAAGDIFALNGASIAEFSSTGVLQSQVTPAPITISSSAGFQTAPAIFQADGTYLVGRTGPGTTRHDIDAQVFKFLPTGAADPSFSNPPFDFGTEGPPGTDLIQGIARQADGKIVVAGLGNGNGFGTARLNTNGSLDATFGSGGVVTGNLPADSSHPNGSQASVVLVQPDGKILVIGQQFSNDTAIAPNIALVRYLAS